MSDSVRIAIASGKGGTGKTTIATNLARVLSDEGRLVAYVDCDVEEPNGHLFLAPAIDDAQEVSIPVPEVDEARCTHCGACAAACRYSALIVVKTTVLVFPKMCHGCGGCTLACPEHAIREVPRPIGVVERGNSGRLRFVQGRLEIGEAMSPPVIRAAITAAPPRHTLILDAPPGTSCPVIETTKTADIVLLVTEPTPFGLHDLRLAVGMVRALGVPFAVAVNRAGIGDRAVLDYCAAEKVPVLLELEDDRAIAEAYSRGELAVTATPALRSRFVKLARDLEALAAGPRPAAVGRAAPGEARTEAPAALPSASAPAAGAPPVCELVVLSGKGGTGKTSVVASLFALAQGALVADCDVDAADLHLVLDPTTRHRWAFSGGGEARVDPALCTGCGICAEHCRFDALHATSDSGREVYAADPIACEGCGVCADSCPEGAVRLVPSASGEWRVSDTRFGPLVHARLGVAQENSGKLVSLVRKEARALARSRALGTLICDGSPGVGCPVIASIGGAQLVLVVTEPTLSAVHDMRRVVELTRHFRVPTVLCINKVDINREIAARVRREAEALDVPVIGQIHYDTAVTRAMVRGVPVVEDTESLAGRELRELWNRLRERLAAH